MNLIEEIENLKTQLDAARALFDQTKSHSAYFQRMAHYKSLTSFLVDNLDEILEAMKAGIK